MLDFKILSKKITVYLRLPTPQFEEFWSYKTLVVEGKRYLPWLTRRFQQNGGLVERQRLKALTSYPHTI